MEIKVKIIIPPQIFSKAMLDYNRIFTLKYGVGLIVSYLRGNNVDVSILDLCNKKNIIFSLLLKLGKKIFSRIKDQISNNHFWWNIDLAAKIMIRTVSLEGIDLVGISVHSRYDMPAALLLAKKIKEKQVVPIVLGGNVINNYELYGKKMLSAYPFIDYLIVSEGEVPLLRLIRSLEGSLGIDKVPNLVYRDGNKIIANSRKDFDVEDMPIPDFRGLDFKRYFFKSFLGNILVLPYSITKGCPYKCSFCYAPVREPTVQMKTLKKVVKDLVQMKAIYNSNYFFFCSNLLNISNDYLAKICEMFCNQNVNIYWIASISVSGINKKLLEKMRRAGCRSIIWGIETGSERMLRLMNKQFSPSQAEEVLRIANKLGIRNIANIITGFIHETEEDIDETINFIRKNEYYLNHIYLTDFKLFFGTPIFLNPQKYGIENISPLSTDPCSLNFGVYGYDEINGLKWDGKVKQKERYYKKVKREVDKILFREKFRGIC